MKKDQKKENSEIKILEKKINNYNKECIDSIYAKDFFESCFPNPKNKYSFFILLTNKDLKSNIDYINACENMINLCMNTVLNDLNQNLKLNRNEVKIRYSSYQIASSLMLSLKQLSKVVDISDELKTLIIKNKEIVNQKVKLFEEHPVITDLLYKFNEISKLDLGKFNRDMKSNSEKRKNPSGGCYIATMVYGNYNHSQVKELRKFRDNILIPNPIGRLFVKIYYKISPKIVDKLDNKERIHSFLRFILDRLVNWIR